MIRYAPFALDSNLLYVILSVVFKLFVLPESGGLHTNTRSSILNTGVLCTRMSYSYLYHFRTAVSSLSTVSLIKASLGKKRLGIVKCHKIPDKSEGIADGMSNVVTSGGFLTSFDVNGDTAVDRWPCVLYAFI